ncbi:MAG TPA: hypothetical protein VHE83_16835 [Mycobacteriales bacterium]|nr:hypothetical protein [Mycobacteriales bacterium]
MTVIIIVALLGVGSCGALILGGVRLAKGPIKATDSYFSAIKRGDVEAAFARQCPSLQATATPTALRDAYDTDPVISWHTRGFQDSTDFNGNTVAVVSGTLTRQDGAQLLDVQLEKDGRDWLVCGGVPQPR